MKKHLTTAFLMTAWTTVLLGLVYPLVVTAVAQTFFRDKANGQLMVRGGVPVGSRMIGQAFTGPGYFHSRPSAAGNAGYDAANSQGSNLGPTNRRLVERIEADVARTQSENPGARVPADLVTTSASGLDPDISPAAADFQVPRVARERNLSQDELRALIQKHLKPRQFAVLGEPRVNVLELNLALDNK